MTRRLILHKLWPLLLYTSAVMFSAQTTTAQESKCFNIHIRLNAKPIEGPRVLTLGAKGKESTASLEEGCFKVPPALLTSKALDVSFTIPGNKIHLSGIAAGFFAGSWDINLADKKFGSEVSLPKHARVKEACAVVFHVGEPEVALVQTGCRKSFP